MTALAVYLLARDPCWLAGSGKERHCNNRRIPSLETWSRRTSEARRSHEAGTRPGGLAALRQSSIPDRSVPHLAGRAVGGPESWCTCAHALDLGCSNGTPSPGPWFGDPHGGAGLFVRACEGRHEGQRGTAAPGVIANAPRALPSASPLSALFSRAPRCSDVQRSRCQCRLNFIK